MVTVSVDTLATIIALITTLAGQTWILERRLGGRIDRLEDRMDARFAAVDARFAAADARIDSMDAKFERKFEQVDRRFEQVDRRFDQMHQQMFALAAGLQPLVEQAKRADAG